MNIIPAPSVLLSDPEAIAMMQAFYSRSKRGIESRLEETTLDLGKIKDKLAQFYVGYGHDSIGQCGNVVFFIENVSVLAAKAIQHDRLYNGQESSTRYIDFSKERTYNPFPEIVSYDDVAQSWINLYSRLVGETHDALIAMGARAHNMVPSDPDWPTLVKAAKVKAFDICSAFLPNSVMTNLSWSTSLANLNKNLLRLAGHVLPEVRAIARRINDHVRFTYPSIYVPFEDRQTEIDAIRNDTNHSYTVLSEQPFMHKVVQLQQADLDVRREGHAVLPHNVHASHFMTFTSALDFRSFRDVQRHRTLNPSSPLVVATNGIYHWYTDALFKLGIKYRQEMNDLIAKADKLPGDRFVRQYAAPLGTIVKFNQSGYLGDWLYYAELRTGETVHATVRDLVFTQWHALSQNIPSRLLYNLNPRVKKMEDGLALSFKRAGQDIVER